METSLIIIFILIVGLNAIIIQGLIKLKKSEKLFFDAITHISVVIAAKNESHNISSTIKSLIEQNYPPQFFEIIIVDDNSDDNTYEIASYLANFFQEYKIKIIRAKDKKYKGKKGAIDIGIRNASYDIVAITDADCIVEKNWLAAIATNIRDKDMIFGLAPFYKENSFINQYYNFEFIKNSALTFAACKIGMPYSCAARSLAYKKSLYFELSGFDKANQTLSGDDDLLLQLAIKEGKKIDCFIRQDAFAYSRSPSNFSEYFKQKKRHLSASFYYSALSKIFLTLWHGTNALSLFAPFILCAFEHNNKPLLFLAFAVAAAKISFDRIQTNRFLSLTNDKLSFFKFIIMDLFYEIMITINFLNSLGKKYEWKKKEIS